MNENKEDERMLSEVAGKGTFWTSAGNVVSKITSFAAVFVILRQLTVYEYGVFQLAMTVFTFGGMFILSNLTDVIITDINLEERENPERAKGILLSFFKAQMVLAIAAWAFVFFFGGYVAETFLGSQNIESFMKIVSFFFLLSPARTLFTVIFTVNLEFFKLTVHSLTEEFLRVGFILLIIWYMKKGVAGLLLANVIAQILSLIIILPLFLAVYRRMAGSRSEKVSIFDILARHGKWALLVSYVSNINKNLRIWLIRFFVGTEAVGLYSVAAGLFGHVKSLIPFGSIIKPIVPKYIHDKERIKRILGKSLKYLLVGFAGLGVAAYFIFPPIITAIFPKYIESMGLYRIMLLALVSVAITTIVTPVFYALKQQRSLFFAYTTRIILTLAFLPLFVKIFGLPGIAYEFVLTGFIFALERYFIIRRHMPHFRISVKSIFSVDSYDRVILERIRIFFMGWLNKILRRE